jgi:two-component system response regulator YesN
MNENFHQPISMGEIARSANLSLSRLSHLFKIEVGTSPAKYLKQIRMEKAKHLLETSFLSIKEIMFAVGFNDSSYFTRSFKRFYGMSPTAYREMHFTKITLNR